MSSLPSHDLSQGDEDVPTPLLGSILGSIRMRPDSPQSGRDERRRSSSHSSSTFWSIAFVMDLHASVIHLESAQGP